MSETIPLSAIKVWVSLPLVKTSLSRPTYPLNAAMDTARSCEEGRGFAVVAGEIRTFAHRSATAIRDIKQLIEKAMSRWKEACRLSEYPQNSRYDG